MAVSSRDRPDRLELVERPAFGLRRIASREVAMRPLAGISLCLVVTGQVLLAAGGESAAAAPNWVPKRGAFVHQRTDAIALESGVGWLRSERVYNQFALAVEFRLVGGGSAGALEIDGWPDDAQAPAYRLPLTSTGQGADAVGRIRAVNQPVPAITFDAAAGAAATRPAGEWQRLRVEASREVLRVFVNDLLVSTVDAPPRHLGYLVWTVRRGRLEFRNPRLARLDAEDGTFAAAVIRANAPGVTPPTVTRRTKPVYPSGPLQAWIQGVVGLDAVIDTAGRVADLNVVNPLHPDLDAAAIKCVRDWRFTPATRNGTTVSTVVHVEISFQRTR